MTILNFLSDRLDEFRPCFSREKTFKYFVIVIIGLMACTNMKGITSIINALHLDGNRYLSLLGFFRSDAYEIKEIRNVWAQIVSKCGFVYRLNGKVLLIGDGTKIPKEGKRMPGVKKLHQESEDNSKAEYIYGHMFGCIGVILKSGLQQFCLPLTMSIQCGLKEVAQWSDKNPEYALSHIVQIVQNAYHAAKKLGPSYCVLDRYFLTIPCLNELNRLNEEKHLLDLIVRVKSNCVAFLEPPAVSNPGPGRPRKKGTMIKLKELFETSENFSKADIKLCSNKKKTFEYLVLDLLWGDTLYQKLRFVLVKSDQGNSIFASTDLSLDPEHIIEAYSYRFCIESTFKNLKQFLGGGKYRFWGVSVPKLKRFRKTGEPSELSKVTSDKDRKLIIKTVNATQRYVQLTCIALGLAQLIALTRRYQNELSHATFRRTAIRGKISEETALSYLRKNIFWLFNRTPSCDVSRFILEDQCPDSGYHCDDPDAA